MVKSETDPSKGTASSVRILSSLSSLINPVEASVDSGKAIASISSCTNCESSLKIEAMFEFELSITMLVVFGITCSSIVGKSSTSAPGKNKSLIRSALTPLLLTIANRLISGSMGNPKELSMSILSVGFWNCTLPLTRFVNVLIGINL